MIAFSAVLFFFSLISASLQDTHSYKHDSSFIPDRVLSVTAADVTNGCVERHSVLVNNSLPAPELRFTTDRVVWIRVWNNMPDANLTMHWHGLAQAAAPFADGTPHASQWPIPPNHFFDYELDLRDMSPGTYFYHSHVGFQAVSATGPLILTDVADPLQPYDEERTIFLSDVFNQTDAQIEGGLTADPFKWSGETNGILINGVGATQSSTTTKGNGCGMAKINVDPDRTYRFRFINGGALSLLSLGIEGHDSLALIEADGEYVQPHNVSFIQIATGQRFSAIIKTKSCDELEKDGKTEYFIQAETRERPTLARGYATLNYKKACGKKASPKPKTDIPTGSVVSLPPIQLGWLDYVLRPLSDNNFPKLSEVTRRVTVTVQQIVKSRIVWAQNNNSWTEEDAPVPYLVALYEDAQAYLPDYNASVANGGIDPKTGVFPAKIGEVLEIVIQNSGATSGALDVHPFHMHGAHYYDIGSGNGTYDVEANEEKLKGTAPIRRDTTMLYRYGTKTTPGANAGWTAFRLRVEDPGVYMLHCHILQHMIMGMQTVWVFGDREDLLKIPQPQVQGYLTYGGDVYGNSTYSPSMVHYAS